jgi:hypothetical protein
MTTELLSAVLVIALHLNSPACMYAIRVALVPFFRG